MKLDQIARSIDKILKQEFDSATNQAERFVKAIDKIKLQYPDISKNKLYTELLKAYDIVFEAQFDACKRPNVSMHTKSQNQSMRKIMHVSVSDECSMTFCILSYLVKNMINHVAFRQMTSNVFERNLYSDYVALIACNRLYKKQSELLSELFTTNPETESYLNQYLQYYKIQLT